jgi:hypothetical protein
MSKQNKLLIMFICTLISALIVPIFTQWYEEKTGIFPGAFCFLLCIGGILCYVFMFMNQDDNEEVL